MEASLTSCYKGKGKVPDASTQVDSKQIWKVEIMSAYKMPGHGWGAVGHRLRSMAEMQQWSYPIASREKHRTIVMEHQSEERGLMITNDDSEKIPEEPPQEAEEIVDYCCGFPVWGKRAPVTKKRLFPLADPWMEESSR